jgi:hypothetical protein
LFSAFWFRCSVSARFARKYGFQPKDTKAACLTFDKETADQSGNG